MKTFAHLINESEIPEIKSEVMDIVGAVEEYDNAQQPQKPVQYILKAYGELDDEGDSWDGGVQDINEAIEKDYSHVGDLKKFLDEPLKSLIQAIGAPIVTLDKLGYAIYWKVVAIRELTPEEQNELVDYIDGQSSDGWGEGFEQKAIATYDGVEDDDEDQNSWSVEWKVYFSPWNKYRDPDKQTKIVQEND